MPAIEEEKFDSWISLSTQIDDYFTHYNTYIFRGQAEASWGLEPSLTRALARSYPGDNQKLGEWQSLLAEFKFNLRGRCSIDLNTTSNDELWALGQHYGLYTPMLDWTRSPYVALFFALNQPCTSGERALWALLEPHVDSLYKKGDKTPASERITLVEPMTHHNPRLVSQRGVFLKIPPTQSLVKQVEASDTQEYQCIYKFVISDSLRNDALAALDLRNINYSNLFPDIGGSAMHTNYAFESEKHLTSMRNNRSSWMYDE
jgi:hypothetical protein